MDLETKCEFGGSSYCNGMFALENIGAGGNVSIVIGDSDLTLERRQILQCLNVDKAKMK